MNMDFVTPEQVGALRHSMAGVLEARQVDEETALVVGTVTLFDRPFVLKFLVPRVFAGAGHVGAQTHTPSYVGVLCKSIAVQNIGAPNLAQVVQYGFLCYAHRRLPYVVMEKADATLLDALKGEGDRGGGGQEHSLAVIRTPDDVISVLGGVCSGLRALHSHGWAHGNLDTRNVVLFDDCADLNEGGCVVAKLVGFGCARPLTSKGAAAKDVAAFGLLIAQLLTLESCIAPAFQRKWSLMRQGLEPWPLDDGTRNAGLVFAVLAALSDACENGQHQHRKEETGKRETEDHISLRFVHENLENCRRLRLQRSPRTSSSGDSAHR